MAHQFPAQQQAHPAQMPPHQNIGQQRQNPTMQQNLMAQQNSMTQQQSLMGQQRGMQNPNTLQNGYAKYDPQFALFTLERQKGADGWEDVEAEQQHINTQDLQNDVRKFQKAKNNVKRVMEEIPSSNARRLINELVEEQNQKLMVTNRTIQWSIASIEIKWKTITRSKRQLQRISVILQTGPSGYEDPQAVRAAATMGAKIQPAHQGQGFPQQSAHTPHDMPQLQRNPQHPAQQPMGHMQQQAQQMRPPPPQAHAQHGQIPPPPPPPHGMSDLPPPPPGASGAHLPHLPPPPPGAVHGMPRQPGHGQQQRPMPGAFPGAAHRPAMRQGQPPIEVLDPAFYKKQKKHKDHHEESSSDSESDSDEWDTESGDSVPDRFRGRKVEHGEFVHIGKPKRGRSRKSSQSKKSRHNKSHSKLRSRSRSHVRTEHRRRRDSDYIEPPPMGKYSPLSSKDSSPRSSKQQLPPIHIHMNTSGAEKSTRSNERVRRDSFGASSPDYRKHKFSAEPMSREGSWDRHSGTASFNDNSSIHTADDSVFSEPERRRSMLRSDIVEQPPKLRSRNLPHRQENFGYPHTSQIYGEVEPRQRRAAHPNDYPQHRESYFDDTHTPRPSMNRRNSVQVPQSNPFDTTRYPPRLPRSSTFNEPLYGQREPRYIDDRAAADDLNMADIAEAIHHIKESRRRPLAGHTRRVSDMGGYGGGYDMYDRRGY